MKYNEKVWVRGRRETSRCRWRRKELERQRETVRKTIGEGVRGRERQWRRPQERQQERQERQWKRRERQDDERDSKLDKQDKIGKKKRMIRDNKADSEKDKRNSKRDKMTTKWTWKTWGSERLKNKRETRDNETDSERDSKRVRERHWDSKKDEWDSERQWKRKERRDGHWGTVKRWDRQCETLLFVFFFCMYTHSCSMAERRRTRQGVYSPQTH